jgi:MFS family permease
MPSEYLKRFRHFQRNAQLYLISAALSGVSTGIVLVLYNLYLHSLGYRTNFIGLILFIGTIGIGLAIFPAGVCVDLWGGKVILIWSSMLIAIAGVGQILLPMPVPLLVTTFIVGIGSAFILVVNVPFLTMHSLPTERSELFSLNIGVTLVTTVLGEILGGVLPLWLHNVPWLMASLPSWYTWILVRRSESRAYELALLFASVIAIPSLIPLLLMQDDRPRSNQSILAVSSSRLHLPSMERIRSFLLTRRDSVSSQSRSYRSFAHPVNLRQQRYFIRTLFGSPLFALVVVQILIGLGAGLFIPYFNLYFVKHLGASSALFGLIDGCANLLNAMLALLAPWLVVHIGKVRTILFPRLLSLPIMLVIGLTSFLPLVTVLYPVRQGLMDMTQGILQLFLMEAVQQQHRGLANSSYQAAFQLASACGAPIGGLIIAHQGYPPVFICATILYSLALAVFWLCFRGSDDRNPPET